MCRAEIKKHIQTTANDTWKENFEIFKIHTQFPSSEPVTYPLFPVSSLCIYCESSVISQDATSLNAASQRRRWAPTRMNLKKKNMMREVKRMQSGALTNVPDAPPHSTQYTVHSHPCTEASAEIPQRSTSFLHQMIDQLWFDSCSVAAVLLFKVVGSTIRYSICELLNRCTTTVVAAAVMHTRPASEQRWNKNRARFFYRWKCDEWFYWFSIDERAHNSGDDRMQI